MITKILDTKSNDITVHHIWRHGCIPYDKNNVSLIIHVIRIPSGKLLNHFSADKVQSIMCANKCRLWGQKQISNACISMQLLMHAKYLILAPKSSNDICVPCHLIPFDILWHFIYHYTKHWPCTLKDPTELIKAHWVYSVESMSKT